jgi:quinol monooxygenase YgiN
MSLLVACFREAQPGRVADVRQAVQIQAATLARQFSGTRTYEVLQGCAKSNLYVDLIEWDDPQAFEAARGGLDTALAERQRLFLHPTHLCAYRPRGGVRLQQRQPVAVGVGLIRVRPGAEEAYARRMCDLVRTRFPEQPGLITAGVYQDVDTPRQFLVRNTWDSTEALNAHQRWITHTLFPLTDPFVERREILALLLHWSSQQAAGSVGSPFDAAGADHTPSSTAARQADPLPANTLLA